ncbi:protein TASOR-like isoform X2 [Paramormyrops kingsleyae]|uniref:protein TASOR-like isoform X2 n=1 Tax=Paramormyrops kingsleyae TaxID=1676925 RepID=UPI000CD5E701|nr:protein TASOR-like isoform X2 [Paramormyrops kingsleyae]
MDGIDGEGNYRTTAVGGSVESPGISDLSLAASAAVTRNKDGEETAYEAPLSRADVAEGRALWELELDPSRGYQKMFVNPAEEAPRRNFHIPRKNKEKKALFQYLSLDSREFEDILKILSCSYLQSSSAGTFVYAKAQLVHSDLLVNNFVEKRKELKQNGRTDSELLESYSFLLSDCYKLQEVCEKGLSVGHTRSTTLGDPAKGVYLSRYSDLLQINPFDVGATGEIIIFKVLKGKVKTVSVSKNIYDPTPNFDCHVSKNSYKVTSCLSYRAFELTQQYFYEYQFDEIRTRPRQVCPFAIVSFIYQGNTALPAPKPAPPLRLNSGGPEGSKGIRGYTVWSGQLLNQGRVLYHASIRSSTHFFLPLKLPEKLEIGTAMRLEDVKKTIPAAVFSWEAYRQTGEYTQDGLHCNLFLLEESSKQENGFSSLLMMLEKGRLVLVQPLVDKGFLFLLSSAQMVSSFDVGSSWVWSLHALFVFREPRGVKNLSSKRPAPNESMRCESQDLMPMLKNFLPALHYALLRLRSRPQADLGSEVERQARAYLLGCFNRTHRRYWLPKYKHSYDEQNEVNFGRKQKHNFQGNLHSYLYCPKVYQLAVAVAKEMVESLWCPAACNPVSDLKGVEGKSIDGKCQEAPVSLGENDPGKVAELLKLIRLQRRNQGEDKGNRKRKADNEVAGLVKKYLRLGESRKGSGDAESENPESLLAALNLTGICDTDLRQRQDHSSSATSTQTLLEMLLGTLQKALVPGQEGHKHESQASLEESREVLEPAEVDVYSTVQKISLPDCYNIDPRIQTAAPDQKDRGRINSLEEEACDSVSSIDAFSPCSSSEIQPGPDQNEEFVGPWRLIPITGIKPCKYSAREDDDPYDPRFTDFFSVSRDAAPEASHDTELEDPSNMETDHPVISSDTSRNEDLKLKDCIPAEQLKDVNSGNLERIEDEMPEDLGGAFNQCSSGVDCILSEEISSFYGEMQDILKGEHVQYSFKMQAWNPQNHHWQSATVFSEYVTHYTQPVPIDGYVSTLRERMRNLICLSALGGKASISTPPRSSVHDLILSRHIPTPPPVLSHDTTLTSRQERPLQESQLHNTLPQQAINKQVYPQPRVMQTICGSPSVTGGASHTSMANATLGLGVTPCSSSINSVISQMRPEFFSSLMEIIRDVQKNTVKFYVHSLEESNVCSEIKSYLIQLGNAECKPQDFLERKDVQDKLLIIIQNKDIAAHIHTIPALLCLKELPSVSFAGVDSLEDVKNRTYNELFVSGGFIVSDEFVLNPDFIGHNRLECFMKFLEGRSSTDTKWCWKIHCKTQKKLKELARVNRNALELLSLLSTYQKRHVVEFLPYHECDTAGRHAPDLECLIRLQAQHTQYRHTIFLTERRLDLSPHYSDNGIMIASMSDFMDCLPWLIDSDVDCNTLTPCADGGRNVMEGIPLESEELSLGTERLAGPIPDEKTELMHPPSQMNHFQLPNPHLEAPETGPPNRFLVLKEAVCQRKDSAFPGSLRQEVDGSMGTPLGTDADLNQNFAHSASPWSDRATPTSISPRAGSQHDFSGLICGTGVSPNTWSFNIQDQKERSGCGNLVPRPANHSVTVTALLGGAGIQEARLPPATSEMDDMHCRSKNVSVYNWGLRQDDRARLQRYLEISRNRFSST